jgi:PKD repeat protein
VSKRMLGIGVGVLVLSLLVISGCSLFNEKPSILSITASPLTGKAPLTVRFTPNVTDDGEIAELEYYWEFGDGVTSHERAPSHTFTTVGIFYVYLTVTDKYGSVDTFSQSIEATNPGPDCKGISYRKVNSGCSDCGVPPYCASKDQIQFSAISPNHPIDGKYITDYDWDFGNGDTPRSGNPVVYSYNLPGVYTVRLTLTDNDGVSNYRETTITIEECCRPCVPNISIDASGCRKVDCTMEFCGVLGNGHNNGCERLASALAAKSPNIDPKNYCGDPEPCDCDNSCGSCNGCRDGAWEWRFELDGCETIEYGECVNYTPEQTGSLTVRAYYTCNGKSSYATETYTISE